MKFSLFILLFICNSLFASDLDEIADNPGCSYNTTCSKNQGEQRKSFRDFLISSPSNKELDKYFKKNGTPINFYVTGKTNENEFIMYDSKCPNHNLKDQKKIFIGQKFIKDFKDLDGYKDQIFITNVTILTNKKEFITIPLSQGVFPSFLEGTSLYSTMDFEGQYYGLTSFANGKIHVGKPVAFDKHPEKIKCPAELESFTQTQKITPNLAIGHFCRRIWDRKAGEYVPALFSHFCH